MEKNFNVWSTMPTDEKVDLVKRAYAAVRPTAQNIASYIGNHLGCSISKSSIVRFYSRQTVHMHAYPLEGMHANGQRPRPLVGPSIVAKSKARPGAHHAFRPKAMPADATEPQAERRTTVDLRARDCRWPVDGQGQDMLYCCETTSVGQSYCAYHRALSLGKGTEGERTAFNALLKSA